MSEYSPPAEYGGWCSPVDNLPAMDVKLLRSFVAFAEEEHVGRAAARLYISQPALTKQLRKLEDSLQVSLTEKTGRRVRLTESGRVLAEEARRILNDVDQAVERVRAVARAQRDEVVIAFVPPMPRELTTEVFRNCGDLGCDVVLRHVDWKDQVSVVAGGRADLALVRGPLDGFPEAGRLGHERLFAEPRVAGFAAGHPLAGRPSLTLAELADEPIVVTSPNTPFWTVDPRPGGRAPVLGPTVGTVAEMLEVVAAGRAMVLTARSQSEYFARPDIRYVPVRDVSPSEVFVAWSPSRLTPGARRVLDDLRNRAGRLADRE